MALAMAAAHVAAVLLRRCAALAAMALAVAAVHVAAVLLQRAAEGVEEERRRAESVLHAAGVVVRNHVAAADAEPLQTPPHHRRAREHPRPSALLSAVLSANRASPLSVSQHLPRKESSYVL